MAEAFSHLHRTSFHHRGLFRNILSYSTSHTFLTLKLLLIILLTVYFHCVNFGRFQKGRTIKSKRILVQQESKILFVSVNQNQYLDQDIDSRCMYSEVTYKYTIQNIIKATN